MSERSVSDLVFRDFDRQLPPARSAAERAADFRRELDKLRAPRPAPRVVPAAPRRSAEQRLQ